MRVFQNLRGAVVYQAEFDLTHNRWGENCKFFMPCNIYGVEFGDDVHVGPFVEIQQGVKIGNRVKIGSHAFICAGTVIEDDVFVGHSSTFCNDRWPRASIDGRLKEIADWICEPVIIKKGASIGSGAVLLPGVVIGEHAMVGAGAVVTKSVADRHVVVGNPAACYFVLPPEDTTGKVYEG